MKNVFIRIDDVFERDRRLEELLYGLSEREIKFNLEIIPALVKLDLFTYLEGFANYELHQHGFMHRNNSSTAKKNEFGNLIDLTSSKNNIEKGIGQLKTKRNFFPIFSFPWDIASSEIIEYLPYLGFLGFSVSTSGNTPIIHHQTIKEVSVFFDYSSKIIASIDLGQWECFGFSVHYDQLDEKEINLLFNFIQKIKLTGFNFCYMSELL